MPFRVNPFLSTLRSSLDTESSFDPEVSGPKGGTKCRTEGQDEPCPMSGKLLLPIEAGIDPASKNQHLT